MQVENDCPRGKYRVESNCKDPCIVMKENKGIISYRVMSSRNVQAAAQI